MKTTKTLLALVRYAMSASAPAASGLDVQDTAERPPSPTLARRPSPPPPAPPTCTLRRPTAPCVVTSDGPPASARGMSCRRRSMSAAAGVSKGVLETAAKVCVNEQSTRNHAAMRHRSARAEQQICVVGDCVCPAGPQLLLRRRTGPGRQLRQPPEQPSDCGECGHVCRAITPARSASASPTPRPATTVSRMVASPQWTVATSARQVWERPDLPHPADCVSNYCDATGTAPPSHGLLLRQVRRHPLPRGYYHLRRRGVLRPASTATAPPGQVSPRPAPRATSWVTAPAPAAVATASAGSAGHSAGGQLPARIHL